MEHIEERLPSFRRWLSHRQRLDRHLCLLLRENSSEGTHWRGGRSSDLSVADRSCLLVMLYRLYTWGVYPFKQ